MSVTTRRPRRKRFEQCLILPAFLQWLGIATLVGVCAGSASALFLWLLDMATHSRESHPWLLALLPLGGLAVGWVYHQIGHGVEAGNNLLLEEIHDPKAVIPLRMAPLILVGTIATHVFGGSAGREGTAVQMGGALADQLTKLCRLTPDNRRILLMAGMSAGFASVFGTPLAGAVFGLEVLALGRLTYEALLPCFIAAWAGHAMTLAWGIHHTAYAVGTVPDLTFSALVQALLTGILCGGVGALFAGVTHGVARFFKARVAYPPLRPFVGGILVALAAWVLGSTRYLGLGIPVMVASFQGPVPPWDFALKLLFTAVTLGAGFKGGEVTPLFFIGATLGNALSHVLSLPAPLLTGMGFVAVFAGAANTPLTCTLMAMEIFGAPTGLFAGIACVASYMFSGHAGIYHAQRIGVAKHAYLLRAEGTPLGHLPHQRPPRHIAVFRELHPWGFLRKGATRHEGIDMPHVYSLRLYFRHGSKAPKGLHQGWWRTLFVPTLGVYLLREAKNFGIRQAILHRVFAGYMDGEALAYEGAEVSSPKMPQCVELLDAPDKLRAFAQRYATALQGVRIVYLQGHDSVLADNQGKPWS